MIQNLRTSVDEYHSKWYNDELNLAEKVDITESYIKKLGNCSRQTYWSNQPLETTKKYFKVVLTASFLDHVLTDLQYRFAGNELVPYYGLYLIPYLMFQEPENWKEEYTVFANFSFEDLPNVTGLGAELGLWYNFWDEIKYKTDLPDSTPPTLKEVGALAFPNKYIWPENYLGLCLLQRVNVRGHSHLFGVLRHRTEAQWRMGD